MTLTKISAVWYRMIKDKLGDHVLKEISISLLTSIGVLKNIVYDMYKFILHYNFLVHFLFQFNWVEFQILFFRYIMNKTTNLIQNVTSHRDNNSSILYLKLNFMFTRILLIWSCYLNKSSSSLLHHIRLSVNIILRIFSSK